jgi:hypothetical protein
MYLCAVQYCPGLQIVNAHVGLLDAGHGDSEPLQLTAGQLPRLAVHDGFQVEVADDGFEIVQL